MEKTVGTPGLVDDVSMSLACGICYEDYNSEAKKPHVMKCGHSLCNECLSSIISNPRANMKACPFDKKPLSSNIGDYPVNWAYLEMITMMHQKAQQRDAKPTPANAKKLTLPNGMYEGEVSGQSKRQGIGKMTYKNGTEYEGEWKNDARKGKGKLTYRNGDVYEGDWENDQQNGQGVLNFKAGKARSYSGGWKNGKYFGIGTMTYDNNTRIEGIYCGNEQFGAELYKQITNDSIIIGKYQNINSNFNTFIEGYELNEKGGYVSKGIFLKSAKGTEITRQGEFTMTFNSGDVFLLKYEGGICCKKGEIRYANGDCYKGEIEGMKRNGFGSLVYQNKDKYEGDFKDDLFDGEGVYYYENGGCYQGGWKRNLRHGTGKFTKQKYFFDGNWEAGEKNGIGVETMENGESYTGSFKNNVKDGEGLYIFKNFDTYKGHWKNNEMDGQGTFIYNTGNEVYGVWVKGKLQSGKDQNGKTCLIF